MGHKSELKKVNRRAMPKFLLIMGLCLLFGWLIGFYGVKAEIYTLSDSMTDAAAFFGNYLAPWLMLVEAVLIPAICIPIYRSAKKMHSAWDGENDEIPDAIDRRLSTVMWITNGCSIISYLFIAATYTGIFANYPNGIIEILNSDARFISFIVGFVSFLIVTFEAVKINKKCIDTTMSMNPEKKVSYLDTKFQKKWMDCSDEAEKIKVGKCALAAYSTTNALCTALASMLAVCALFFDIGFLPSLVVCLIGVVNQSVYYKELIKYSKTGSKIS